MDDRTQGSFEEGQVHRFFDDLQVRFATIEELDLYLSNRFNVFRCLSPDERNLSSIIRDLMDAKGTHGQGERFLKCFLDVLDLKEVSITNPTRPECEVPTSYGRKPHRWMDIELSPDGRFGIGIENKPWARDQPGWVEDYAEHLGKKYHGNYLLLFLTRTDREPESAQDKGKKKELEDQGKFRTLHFDKEFRYWLECCWKECQSERVRSFLKDFRNYALTMEGTGMVSENEVRLVLEYMEKRPESLRVAWAARSAWNQLKERRAEEFLGRLQGALDSDLSNVQIKPDGAWASGWKMDNPGKRILEKYAFRMYKPPWGGRHAIVLEADDKGGKNFFIGVWKNGANVPHIDGLDRVLDQALTVTHGKPNDWWEWWRWADDRFRNWDAPDTLGEMLKEDALEYFKNAMLDIAKIAVRLIDSHYNVKSS
jgi:hypothetical protein